MALLIGCIARREGLAESTVSRIVRNVDRSVNRWGSIGPWSSRYTRPALTVPQIAAEMCGLG